MHRPVPTQSVRPPPQRGPRAPEPEQGVRLHAGRIRREERSHKGRALRRLRALSKTERRSSGPGPPRRPLYLPARFLQRSVVKVSYSRNTQKRGWSAHGRYLARAGAQREHERGLGFDAERNEIHLEQRLSGWEREKDPRLWKVMVSPELAPRLDLRAHARQLADRIERDLGRCLEWVAIDHYDTSHPHVHLLIRGVDREGRVLFLPKDYVKFGLRRGSQELATLELGLPRDRERVRRELEFSAARDAGTPDGRDPPGLDRDRVLERPRVVARP